MQPYLTISIFIFALLILWLPITVPIGRTSDAGLQPADRGKHPQGYWMSVGMSTGVAIGAALWLLFDNIGVAIAVGIALGAAIGASLEQRNKGNLRPPTEREKRVQRWGLAIGLVVAAVLGLTLLIVLLLQAR